MEDCPSVAMSGARKDPYLSWIMPMGELRADCMEPRRTAWFPKELSRSLAGAEVMASSRGGSGLLQADWTDWCHGRREARIADHDAE